tara:strand:+ start:6266 stop:7411 length:1146 start_codon:yes stop_codon:yes gene_type:complete
LKLKFKYIFFIFFLFNFNYLNSFEIIRDPIFEDYIGDISKDLKLNKIDVYLVNNKSANAFVIGNGIYITTGLIKIINNEDTLKAIYLHEYGHVIKNHFQVKKIKLKNSNSTSTFYNLFSVGLAIVAGNANAGIGTSIALNSRLINEISKHSINFEIEADNFMINHIKKNQINSTELIYFLENQKKENQYFRTHPKNSDRINNLKELNYNKSVNSHLFNWIKSKYSNESEDKSFNNFFKKLSKGIFDQEENINNIDKHLIQYEAFKKGLFVENWQINFENLIEINSNSFLKIEYINYILDNNLENKYHIIENLKFNKNIMNEYFYYYIYGKYYDKIENNNLSNFYFCQFYKTINSKNKTNFFCEKYDIKYIPTLDKSYALFK